MTRAERTREGLVDAALVLFAEQGYDATTAAQVAARAGVSEMTFFRHFASKQAVLLDDPYDPLLVDAVAAQPAHLDPVIRVVRGLRAAWGAVPAPADDRVRLRARIAATTPSLVAAVRANTARTEELVARRLVADGTDPLTAEVASAAVLAGVTVALQHWARSDDQSMSAALVRALDVLEASRG